MSRHSTEIKDSLDLLLDTMCNAFGGMVLIAILVALLSKEVRVSEEARHLRDLTTEMIKRRIALAERDIESARHYESELNEKLADHDVRARMSLATHRDQLKSDAATLENSLSNAVQRATAAQRDAAQPPDDRLRSLRAQLDDLNRQCVAEENMLTSAQQNTQRLRQRVSDLEMKEQVQRSQSVIHLRLPKERVQTKASFPVIIRNEQIYFVFDPTSARFPRNTYALSFDEMADGDTKVVPIRGRGLDLGRSATLLRSIFRDDHYITCWVYNDSFRTFNQFKHLIIRSGYEYGWGPMLPDESLVLTSDRVVPPPPL